MLTSGDWRYIAVMVVFLVVAAYVSIVGVTYKKSKGFFEAKRGLKNVVSNGLVPVVFAILNNWVGFLGSMAAVMADKLASELGVFDENVYDVLTLKKAQPGVNGGISFYGTLASAIGSLIIALTGVFLFQVPMEKSLAIFLAGILGSLADSIAGHFEQRGLGTKETSNIIGSIIGGLSVLLLYNLF